jgi:hypothetical protein
VQWFASDAVLAVNSATLDLASPLPNYGIRSRTDVCARAFFKSAKPVRISQTVYYVLWLVGAFHLGVPDLVDGICLLCRCLTRREHEVFLSHSGEQKPFVYDLFKDFRNCSRFQFNEPFFDVQDESLPKGEEWRDRLVKAARNCKVAVLILTKEYLISHWPMLELLHFIDARKTGHNPDIKLIPVFYGGLLPSDLGDQVIEDRWKAEWEKIIGMGSSSKLRKISLTVELCKEALSILKHINGILAQSFKSFELLRKDIVSKVLKHLPSGFDPEEDPNVEGCRRLCDVSLLEPFW